ncbi:MAG: hypothetical protein U0835_02490 [Isosphaeraceae bacterium]
METSRVRVNRRGWMNSVAALAGARAWGMSSAWGQPPRGASARIRPERVVARLLAVSDTHAVWLTQELIQATRDHRARSYVWAYYRQKLSDPEAVLLDSYGSTGGPSVACVTADGTAVIAHAALNAYRPDGRKIELFSASIESPHEVALYPDGALLRDPGIPSSAHAAGFVPFRFEGGNFRLDLAAKVEVVPASPTPFRNTDPIRSGSRFAWVRDDTLHVFDLKDRGRTATKLEPTPVRGNVVSAYDGETAVVGPCAFDARTGAALGGPKEPGRPMYLAWNSAVRHRIGYSLDRDKIVVEDLASISRPLATLAPVKGSAFGQTEAGLVVWDGKRWSKIPWLTGWKKAAGVGGKSSR